MRIYGIVDQGTDEAEAFELFVRREDAERFLEEVQADDPELADRLRLEPVELDA
ncbi:MAG: hypothetical protein M3304_09780 [Actinomycetota bacterium]|nr:hypothetical protein [Actinomycetota bacterium]